MKEITKIKEFYNISRKTLHLISGISEDALSRYEKGETVPKKYYLLLNSMCNMEVFERFFELTREQLKAIEIKKIEYIIRHQMLWREREVRRYRNGIMYI